MLFPNRNTQQLQRGRSHLIRCKQTHPLCVFRRIWWLLLVLKSFPLPWLQLQQEWLHSHSLWLSLRAWCFGCSALTKNLKRSFIPGKQEQDVIGLQLCGFGLSIYHSHPKTRTSRGTFRSSGNTPTLVKGNQLLCWSTFKVKWTWSLMFWGEESHSVNSHFLFLFPDLKLFASL